MLFEDMASANQALATGCFGGCFISTVGDLCPLFSAVVSLQNDAFGEVHLWLQVLAS